MDNFNYYAFQKKIVIDKIREEIDFLTSDKYSNLKPIYDYICYLKKRIGIDDNIVTSYSNDKKNKSNTTKKLYNQDFGIKTMNLEEYVKDIDIVTFQKPWNKLKEFHKIMKIKEYISELKYNKKINKNKIESNKKKIIKDIIHGLRNKKFTKGKSEIIYDQNEMKILSIDCIEFNKKTGLYSVDFE